MSFDIDRQEFDEWVEEKDWDRIWAHMDWLREQLMGGGCLRCGYYLKEAEETKVIEKD
jgi:hypothetical protein